MLGRGVTAAVVLVLLLAAPAAALDTWGVREQPPVPSTVDHADGFAVAPDGDAYFVAEFTNQGFGCLGGEYDLLLHRVGPGGASRTVLAGRVGERQDAPLAVTADGRRLLVVVNGATDADGDCAPPPAPPTIVELDARTLEVLDTVTTEDLGGARADRIATTAGATYVVAIDDALQVDRLLRYAGTPSRGTLDWSNDLSTVLDRDGCYGFARGLAAYPDGDALLYPQCAIAAPSPTASGLVRLSGADGRPVALVADLSGYASTGDAVAVAPDGAALVDLRLPFVRPDGSVRAEPRLGVAALRSGSVFRAWGDARLNRDGEPCRFDTSPLLAVEDGSVFTMSRDRRDSSPGPQVVRWGPGGRTGDCLVRPRPDASVTVEPTDAEVGQPVSLRVDAEAQRIGDYDADNAIASVAWRIGDGPYEAAGTQTTRSATFDAPGSYPVDVRVTDAYGAVAEVRRDFVVRAPAPRASLSVSAPTTAVNTDVTLDASATSGSIVRYEFDLDGDGSFETDNGPRATRTHRFLVAGSLRVGLRVTDSSGNQAQTMAPVTVIGVPSPPLVHGAATALPPTAPPETAPPEPAAVPRPPISNPSRVDRRGRLTVRVACPLAAVDTCRLRTTVRRRGPAGSRLSGAATTRLAPGARRRVALRLTAAGRRALRRSGSRPLRATVAVRWNARTATRAVTLRPRRATR